MCHDHRMISITGLSDDEARLVIFTEEGHISDVKSKDVTPAKLSRSLSAFSNAEGGELYIGVDEDKNTGTRTWRGFADVEEANGHIQAFEAQFPLGRFIDYQFMQMEADASAGLVLKVSLLRTPDIKTSTDGTIYVRRGAQNLPLVDNEAIRRLEYEKGVRSFETQTVDAPLDVITDSLAVTGFILDVVPHVEARPWLEKQLLIRDGMPTVAGVLLFADEPQVVLPKQSSIKIYRYATTDAQGSRAALAGQPLTIEGNAYQAIQEAVSTTVDMVQGIRVLGSSGLESVAYPTVTLHEIITNAVLHRDYSIADDIHVRIFDNRIEVESPGSLPAHITPDNILDQRFSRNGNLVRWINKFPDPPNKDVGEGLNAAFDAMKELKLRAPIIVNEASKVIVHINHQRLASPEEMILEYLGSHEEISNVVVRNLTGIGSENTVKRIFQRMIKAGVIESIPGRSLRDSGYRLTRPGS